MRIVLQLAGAMLLLVATGVCAEQKNKPGPVPKPAAKMPAPPRNPGKAPGGAPKGNPGMNNPVNPAQRLMMMTPEQREQVLEKFPPEQQARMRQQLEKLDNLPPAQKERIMRQVQSLSALPLPQQRLIGQQIKAMGQLPRERVPRVRKELLSLLDMSPEDRTARLASEEFRNQFSPDEQRILSDLSNNLPPDYPIAGRR